MVSQMRMHLQYFASNYSLPGHLQVRPPIIYSTCATRFHIFKDVEVDTDRLEISLCWKPMMSALAREEWLIARPLQEDALEDIERDFGMDGTLSRKEKALKLALSSYFCRRARFERSFKRAVDRRNGFRPPISTGHDFSAKAFCGEEGQLINYRDWTIKTFDYKNLWYHD